MSFSKFNTQLQMFRTDDITYNHVKGAGALRSYSGPPYVCVRLCACMRAPVFVCVCVCLCVCVGF